MQGIQALSRSHKIRHRQPEMADPMAQSLNHQLSQRYLKKLSARADHHGPQNRHSRMNNELIPPMLQQGNHMTKNLNHNRNRQLMHGGRLNTNGLLMRQDMNSSPGREGIRRLRMKAPQQNQDQSSENQVNLNNHGLNSARKLTKAEKIIKLNAQREQLRAFSEGRGRTRDHYFSQARENYRNKNNNQETESTAATSPQTLTTQETTSVSTSKSTSDTTTITTTTTKQSAAEEEEQVQTTTTSTTSTRAGRKRGSNPGSRRQEIERKLNALLNNKEESTNSEKAISLSAKRKPTYQSEETQDELIENILKDIEMQTQKSHKDTIDNADLLKEIDSLNLDLDKDDLVEDDDSSSSTEAPEQPEDIKNEETTSSPVEESETTKELPVQDTTVSTSSSSSPQESSEQQRISMNEYVKL